MPLLVCPRVRLVAAQQGLSLALALVAALPLGAAPTPNASPLGTYLKALCPDEVISTGAPKRDNSARGTFKMRLREEQTDLVHHEIINSALNLLADGRSGEAMKALCQVLAARVSAYGIGDPRSISVINNMGVMLRKDGRSREARQIQEEALVLVEASKGMPLIVRERLVQNLGTTLFSQGDYQTAEAMYKSSLIISENDKEPRQDGLDTTMTNLGFALDAQERFAEAEPLYRRVLAMRVAEHGDNQLEIAASMNNLGRNLTEQGTFREGETLLRKGLALREKHLGTNHLNTAFSLVNLAQNLRAQGALPEAEQFALRSLSIRQQGLGEVHPDTASALDLLATIRLERGDMRGALESARTALKTNLLLSDREMAGLSRAARERRLSLPGNSASLLVLAAWGTSAQNTRTWAAGSVSPLVDEAFFATQRIASSSTADALAQAIARGAADANGLGPIASELERHIGKRAQLDERIVDSFIRPGGTTVAHLADLLKLQQEADAKIAQAKRELQTRFPKFFAFLNPSPSSLNALQGQQSHLKEDEVMLIVTPGDDKQNGFVWAVTREEGAWVRLPLSPDELSLAIRRLREVLDTSVVRSAHTAGTSAIAPGARGYDSAAAYALYRALFGSNAILAIAQKKRKWIIVPQGALISLPYAALVTQPPGIDTVLTLEPAMLRKVRWLGLERVVSVLPSVSSLDLIRKLPRASGATQRPFFGLGDPTFSGALDAPLQPNRPAYRTAAANIKAVRELPQLPGTRKEVENLARTLGASLSEDVLLGASASETELRRYQANGWLNRYRILTFATHGLVNGNLAGSLTQPALALSPPVRAMVNDDALLTASEAAMLDLNADWVILSACNSAAGGSPNGEGLTGLTRAFMLAGARAMLVSHWRVRDDAAERLTVRTMQLLRSNPSYSRGEALQAAMRELMMDTRSDRSSSFALPGAWAAFTLVGVD